jgi:AAA domain
MTALIKTAEGFSIGSEIELEKQVFSLTEFLSKKSEFVFVWQNVMVRGFLYALTASPGTGKTSIALLIALHIASGKPIHGRKTQSGRILFLVGENPSDFRLRLEHSLAKYGISPSDLEGRLSLTVRPFDLSCTEAAHAVLADVKGQTFDTVFIDTLPAHSDVEDENSNSESHALAMAVRGFGQTLGDPAIVCLMHPVKGATRETLLPRGGSAFTGSIDGVLCLWKDCPACPVELFPHQTKYRGRHFEPMVFDLVEIDTDQVDNFGEPVQTVVAMESENQKSVTGIPDEDYQQLKVEILKFILELTEHAGEWIGVSTSGTVNNNILKKSYVDKPMYPSLLKKGHADSAIRKAALRAVDDLLLQGLLVLEERFPDSYTPRQRSNLGKKKGLWITAAGKEVVL